LDARIRVCYSALTETKKMRQRWAQLLLGALLSAHVGLFAGAALVSTPSCCGAGTECPMHRNGHNSSPKDSCFGNANVCAGSRFLSPSPSNSSQAIEAAGNEKVIEFFAEKESKPFDPGPASKGFGTPLELPPRDCI
jgi:hypothetical protein